jgi:hypothetical protein
MFDGPALHFAITFPQLTPSVESLEATVTTLVGGSVRSQLLKLHLADRDAPLDTLLLSFGVRRTRLTPDQCPALKRRRTDEFQKLLIKIPDRNYLSAHAVGHRIVMGLHGAHLDFSSLDPGIPLVRWALDTLDALNKCTAA